MITGLSCSKLLSRCFWIISLIDESLDPMLINFDVSISRLKFASVGPENLPLSACNKQENATQSSRKSVTGSLHFDLICMSKLLGSKNRATKLVHDSCENSSRLEAREWNLSKT